MNSFLQISLSIELRKHYIVIGFGVLHCDAKEKDITMCIYPKLA